MVMKKRSISGCVTVIGPPRRICSWKIGTTLPLEASTLPKRTTTNFVVATSEKACTNRSARCFETPMTLVGLTALSVEIITNSCTPNSSANSASCWVPRDVVLDRLAGVVLHHRHVLVGGGMEHDVRADARGKPAPGAGGR